VDYTLAAGTLTFDPNDTSETIDITIVNDGLVEADETIEVTLSNPANATLGANTVHTYTINDNDAYPAVDFDLVSSSGDESATPASLAVSLSAAYVQTVTVDYAVTGGTATGGGVDYTLAAGTLTFDPNDTSKTVAITIVDDADIEPDETIEVTLSNPTNATLGANTVHTYTILDDDVLTILKVGPGQPYSTVQAAVNDASDGDTIEIYSATYTGNEGNALISPSNLTLRGMGATRPILDAGGLSIQGKAIWVIDGANTTVEFIEFRNCDVVDNNGAAIRQQGPDLTLTDCYIHDNEQGILANAGATSDIVVEYCEFDANGHIGGSAHNLYLNVVASFQLRHCWMHNADTGHEVKSRAEVNYIEYNRISNENGTGSYEVQLCDGGTTYIIGNMIQQGPNTSNSTIIAYADESASNPDQHLYVVNNTIVNERPAGATFVYNGSTTDCLLQNNIFVGPGTILSGPGTQVTNWATSDASLVDQANFDYHLTGSSTGAINMGSDPGLGQGYSLTPVLEYLHPTDYESRPVDAPIDIGAYEYDGPAVPSVAFDLAASSDDESVTPASLSVSLSAASSQTVTVDYAVTGGDATGGGVDYTLAAGTLTFDPNDVSETIDISIVDDGDVESDETIEVTLSNPTGATLGANTVHTYTILDNDSAGEPETLFFDDFESGSFTAGGWTTSGSASVSTRADYNGVYGARLQSTSSITKALSTVGYSDIRVTFWRRAQGLDSGEYLYCEWSDDGGQSWNPLGSTQSTSWYQEDFTCPSGADNNSDFRFRYRLNASSTREYGYIDDVEIIGTP